MADTTTPISAAALEDFFETPDLSELDPTTQGGAFRLTYSREVPLEMRLQSACRRRRCNAHGRAERPCSWQARRWA